MRPIYHGDTPLKKKNRMLGRRSKIALAGLALAAVVSAPLTAGAANLGTTPFAVKATNVQESKFFAVRPFLKTTGTTDPGSSPSTGPTSPPATADLAKRTVAMTIDTTLPGCVPDKFNLQVWASINFFPNAQINWGDGSAPTTVKNGQTYSHSYGSGSYPLTIDGTLQGLYRNTDTADTGANNCIKSVDHMGNDSGMTLLTGFLYNAKNVQSVSAPPTTVTDYRKMFMGATSFNGDVSNWDTSKVTNFEGMFFNASSFNQPVNSWKVGASSQFGDMFYGASQFNQDLNSWDMSQAQNMGGMFTKAASFNGDITSWSTPKATVMSSMFDGATVFNRDISNWNTAKVQNFSGMFTDAKAFNQPVGKWNTTSANQVGLMFMDASLFKQDLSSWDFSSVPTTEKHSFAARSSMIAEYLPKGVPVQESLTGVN